MSKVYRGSLTIEFPAASVEKPFKMAQQIEEAMAQGKAELLKLVPGAIVLTDGDFMIPRPKKPAAPVAPAEPAGAPPPASEASGQQELEAAIEKAKAGEGAGKQADPKQPAKAAA